MKTRNCFGVLAATAVLIGMAVAAEAVVNIQNVGAGARSSALGNSFVAVADDPDAVFANPAGLGQLTRKQIAYTNVSLFYGGIDGDDLGQHLVSYVHPLGSKLGLGLGYERIGSDLMNENGAFVAVSYKLSPSMFLGVTGKYLFWKVGSIPDDDGRPDPVSNESAGALGIDVGMLWQTPLWGTNLGFMLKNVNQPNVASGKGAVNLESDAGDVPMDLSVGLSHKVRGTTLVSVEWVMRDLTGDKDNRLVVGGEMSLVEGLMLRAGGSRMLEDDTTGDLNAGLGYRWNKLGFDYGYHIPLDLTETNGTHRFSFGYEF